MVRKLSGRVGSKSRSVDFKSSESSDVIIVVASRRSRGVLSSPVWRQPVNFRYSNVLSTKALAQQRFAKQFKEQQ
jgi:hypothetical protein